MHGVLLTWWQWRQRWDDSDTVLCRRHWRRWRVFKEIGDGFREKAGTQHMWQFSYTIEKLGVLAKGFQYVVTLWSNPFNVILRELLLKALQFHLSTNNFLELHIIWNTFHSCKHFLIIVILYISTDRNIGECLQFLNGTAAGSPLLALLKYVLLQRGKKPWWGLIGFFLYDFSHNVT